MTLECRVVATIEELGELAWNALLPDDNPFVRYAFLHALEQSGAVGGKSGWLPQYLAVFDSETLLGAAPCFLKLHLTANTCLTGLGQKPTKMLIWIITPSWFAPYPLPQQPAHACWSGIQTISKRPRII